MSDDMDVLRGGGNIFEDLGDADAKTRKMKAEIAAEIIATLNRRGLTVRAAGKAAQLDPGDIQRIRNADLSRFTLDRLIRVACRLGRSVEMRVPPETPNVAA